MLNVSIGFCPDHERWLSAMRALKQVLPVGGVIMSLLFQPDCLQVRALFIWAGVAGCDSAQRTRFAGSVWKNEWVWTATRAYRQGQGTEQSPATATPLPQLPSVAPPRPPSSVATLQTVVSTAPLLHYSITHEIPCNLSRRFPLYGVEAGGLPAKAA
jgi:hypothetical protein